MISQKQEFLTGNGDDDVYWRLVKRKMSKVNISPKNTGVANADLNSLTVPENISHSGFTAHATTQSA